MRALTRLRPVFCYAAIASDTSSTTFANSAQSYTTSNNNCALTTPCATSNSGNTRCRHKYSSSSRAPQSDWRAAHPGNTVDPPPYLWNIEPITGAPRSTPPNTQTLNPANVFNGYQGAPFAAQQTRAFGNLMQLRLNQHMPRAQFQQPRGQRAPYTTSQTNLDAVPRLMDTFANPLPLTSEQQQPPPQQSNRSSSNIYAVESAGHDAPQVLAAVKLNAVQIEGALIDSSLSFSIIASLTLSAVLVRP